MIDTLKFLASISNGINTEVTVSATYASGEFTIQIDSRRELHNGWYHFESAYSRNRLEDPSFSIENEVRIICDKFNRGYAAASKDKSSPRGQNRNLNRLFPREFG